jgi:ABC-2 type transport system permease protein
MLTPVALVFSLRDSVLGWSAEDVALVAGLYFFVQALLAAVVEPNLGEVVESVRNGSLDFVLLKPADAQLLCSIRRVQPARIWDVVAAALLIGWALSRLPPPSPADWAAAAALVVSGLAAMYGLWLLAICASFWFVRVDNLRYLLWAISDAGRWPLDVYGPWIRVLLVAVIPVAVVTTFPALALRGRWSWELLALGVGVGLGFVAISRWAWLRALSSYTSASS